MSTFSGFSGYSGFDRPAVVNGPANAMDSSGPKTSSRRYDAEVQSMNGLVNSKIAKAHDAFTQEDAVWSLQSGQEQLSLAIQSLSQEMQTPGAETGAMSAAMAELENLFALLDTAMKNIGAKEQAPVQSADAGQLPLEKLEKAHEGFSEQIGRLVGARLALAQVAISLGLPDHAVFFMQKAYADIRYALDGLIGDLNGREPTGKLGNVVSYLKTLKDKVLRMVVNALSSHGGPRLDIKEAEALLMPESDFDQNKDPAAQKILKNFNLIQSPEELKKHTLTAMDKIAKNLPELLGKIAMNLQNLRGDANAGTGAAMINVNQALTGLEMAKAVLRIGMTDSGNSFKQQAAKSSNLAQYQTMIADLEKLANTIFGELETRGFVRSRSMQAAKPAEPSSQQPEKNKPRTEKPDKLLKSSDPLAQSGAPLEALFGNAGQPAAGKAGPAVSPPGIVAAEKTAQSANRLSITG